LGNFARSQITKGDHSGPEAELTEDRDKPKVNAGDAHYAEVSRF
jgi:hypothetical protein